MPGKHPAKRLRESCFGTTPLTVDRDAGVIRRVKILGPISRNGYRYSTNAMAEAVPMYDGLGCYINHRPEDDSGRERDFRDLFGHFESVVKDPDGVYGDLHFIKSHPLANQVCEAAERMPRNFGLSHEAYWGERAEVAGELVIESLTSISSVDLVTSPATNNGLFESHRSQEPPVKKTSVRKLLEAAGVKGAKILKRLKEADPGMEGIADPAVLDAPVEGDAASAGTDPAKLLKDAINAHVLAVMDDDSLDLAAKIAAITQILTSHSEMTLPTPTPGESPADKTATEAARKLASETEKRLQLLEASLAKKDEDEKARKLLEASQAAAKKLLAAEDVEITDERVEAVVLMGDEAKQKRLIESFPKKSDITLGERPEVSRSVREATTAPGDYAEFKKQFESQLPAAR